MLLYVSRHSVLPCCLVALLPLVGSHSLVQVGLAGSSAIVTATLECLKSFYCLTAQDIPKHEQVQNHIIYMLLTD